MALGDIKTFDYTYEGLTLRIVALDRGDGTTDFQITCVSGYADINALWWSDGDNVSEGDTTLVKSDSSLNMNGTGETWDGYERLSSTGLGKLGWEKGTALTAGETLYVQDVELDWALLDTLGVRATSTSTAGGSIKGVDDSAVVQELPTISIGDVTVDEGDDAHFTVTLSNTYPYDITVSYATADGTAVEGGDYSGATGTVTIPAGQTSATVTVSTTEDDVFEMTEDFTVVLSDAYADLPDAFGGDVPVSASDDSGTATIIDDEQVPTVSISAGNPNPQTEGEGATVTFTISLSGPADRPVTVTYSTLDGTAVAGADFVGVSGGTVVIPAGETSAEVTITLVDDAEHESDETFSVTIDGAVYDQGGADVSFAAAVASGEATIVDDDPAGPSIEWGEPGVELPSPAGGNDFDPNDFDFDDAEGGTSGTANGTINLGSGDDTYTDASTNGGGRTINGLGGNDTIYAGPGGDTLNGGEGNDTLYGQAGNDTLNGGNGDDLIYGGSGNDQIDGGAGNDTIYGGSGNEAAGLAIRGGSGNDLIYGGSGNDAIQGNAGADTIIGGYGADQIDLDVDDDGSMDTLQYLDLLDTNDTVIGFVSGEDVIDLSALDAIMGGADDGFAWAGQTPTNTAQVAAHSISWYTDGSDVIVLADTDGDTTTAEFMITLQGITTIDQADFLL